MAASMSSTSRAQRQCVCRARMHRVRQPAFGTARMAQDARVAQRWRCAAEAEPSTATEDAAAVSMPEPDDSSDGPWIPVMKPEELPKGIRKEVRVGGTTLLMFWYRNQIYAIASRSPAEGAYSQGFIKAKFTQDYGIICPTTGSIFSLRDGSIVEWYPANAVLRAITPKTGSLPIYPVKLTQDAIMVNVASGSGAKLAPTRGGSDSSLENNNVFAIQPAVYVDEVSPEAEGSTGISTVATLTVAITCFAIVATAGTATALFYEDFILLGLFWALMLVVGSYFAFQFLQTRSEATK